MLITEIYFSNNEFDWRNSVYSIAYSHDTKARRIFEDLLNVIPKSSHPYLEFSLNKNPTKNTFPNIP